MKYTILILSLVVTTNCVAQTKHPKKQKVVKTITTKSATDRAVKAAMDTLRVRGYLKN